MRKQVTTNKTNLLILVLILSMALLFCVNTVSAAPGDTVYVNSSGNDNNDGLSWATAKLSIKNATGTVNTNGTVHIADGTYRENNIQINRNMNIIGESQDNTIINGTSSGSSIFTIASGVNVTISNLTFINGTSAKGGAIYNTGNLTVTNCTFTGNNATNFGGAIVNYGTPTAGTAYAYIANCIFTNNTAKNNAGAIYNQWCSNLTVTSCVFDHNTVTSSSGTGGAISNNGQGNDLVYTIAYATIINSTFTNNRAYEGGAIFNSYNHNYLTVADCTLQNNIAAQYGGAIYNAGNCTVTLINTTFKNNTVTGSTGIGGAIYNQATYVNNGIFNVISCTFTNNTAYDGGAIYHIIDIINVTNSTFTQNTATHSGGAIFAAGGGTLNLANSIFIQNSASNGGAIYNAGNCTFTAHFNRIVGNTASSGSAIYNSWGTLDANYNWWGFNNPNFSSLISGTVNHATWLYMTLTANPMAIKNGETSLITVSFNNLFDGTTVTSLDPATGHIPDGTPVTFNTDLGSIGCKTIEKQTTGGIATATLTADETAGIAHVNAVTDTQTVNVDVTIQAKSSLYLTVKPSKTNPVAGDTVVYTLKVGNKGPDTATDVVMTYVVPEGLEFAGANVDVGTYTYDPATRTITWNISDVPVGDPYMWLSLRVAQAGQYVINPVLSTSAYDPTLNSDTQSITVNAAEKTNTVNAASKTKTIPLQETGLPIAGLVLAILAVFGGFATSKKF